MRSWPSSATSPMPRRWGWRRWVQGAGGRGAILALIRDIPDAKEMGLAQGGVGWGGEGMRWVELQVGAGGGLGVEHAGTSHSHSRHLLMLHTALP